MFVQTQMAVETPVPVGVSVSVSERTGLKVASVGRVVTGDEVGALEDDE